MVTENTQGTLDSGHPGSSAPREALPPADWSVDPAGHVTGNAVVSRQAAVPAPPGEAESPPPDKDAKVKGSDKLQGQTQGGTQTQSPSTAPGSTPPQDASKGPPNAEKDVPAPRPVSQAKLKMQEKLPALTDDGDIGRDKEQTVARDGKADLGFSGTLLGSAASTAPKGQWQEYRIYSTSSGKHVFSKVTRSIFADENDKNEADVFDPSPTSVPSQLLRSARELTKSRPMTWMDAAVGFFGYDPLAKVLYRKLSVEFEERV